MTAETSDANFESKYPRRGDRLLEEPSAKNAQGLFPPDACIFVGNLSTKVTTDKLAEDLKGVFTQFGPCHVKIKQDKKKGLPGAFVQFEKVDDAIAALGWDECTMLHDRLLRIERAKGRRTACLGLRSGAPITQQDVMVALGGRGPLEIYCIEPYPAGFQAWTCVCKVTFAYVDDCRDAIKHFQKDDKYYLTLLDMDGSPLLTNPGRYPTRPKLPLAQRSNNTYSKHNTFRQHRNGPPRNQGGHRGFARQHPPPPPPPPPPHSENLPSRAGFPIPPILLNGFLYQNESHHPFYPQPFAPLLPPPSHGYNGPPCIVSSQPRYISPHPPPETFMPPVNSGPFIVGGHPPYSSPAPPYYGGPYMPGSEYFPPPVGINGQPSEYINQPQYNEYYPPSTEHLAPSSNSNIRRQATPPPPSNTCEAKEASEKEPKVVIEEEAVGIEVLLDLEKPDKAPKLIRIYDSEPGSDSDEEDDVSETRTAKPSQLIPVVKAAKAVKDEQHGVQSTKSGSASETPSVCKTSKGVSCNSNGDTLKNSEDTSASSSQGRSRSPSKSNEPLQPSFQPKTGTSIEQYVRCLAVHLGYGFNENALSDVIHCLEDERKKNFEGKEKTAAKEEKNISCEEVESTSSSRACSLTRSCSSRSV